MYCSVCPRNCLVDRSASVGVCGVDDKIRTAFIGLHRWEEPCISYGNGSGAVFFSGCNLGCVYCQNMPVSHECKGKTVSIDELAQALIKLQEMGAANINLVTATHYADKLVTLIDKARSGGLTLPVVYNCGGYEKVETLKTLKDMVDVWLPDFKYGDNRLAEKLSGVDDYVEVAVEAIAEMRAQCRDDVFNGQGGLVKGVLIRHLILPNCMSNSRQVIDIVKSNFGNKTLFSLMSQYFPVKRFENELAFLNRRITPLEKRRIERYLLDKGFSDGYMQDEGCATQDYVPLWVFD